VRVSVTAFARARELLGESRRIVLVPAAAVADDVWTALASEVPEFEALRASVRIARDGRILAGQEPLNEGDEIALLPPFGGG
jgi:molybdopterin converting factor small subunit